MLGVHYTAVNLNVREMTFHNFSLNLVIIWEKILLLMRDNIVMIPKVHFIVILLYAIDIITN